MSVAVVSDSTGYLTADLSPPNVTVVAVAVVMSGVARDEGTGITFGEVADALRRHATVTTSRPAPARFAKAYADLAAEGHEAIVSIHLSAAMSGTIDSARIAAHESPIPVTIVDSRTVGTALGFAVRSAAEVAEAGGSAAEVAAAAQDRAAMSRTWIVVESLDQLRRGGRIGAAQAFLGNALMVKPILTLQDGSIVSLEKQRTLSKALARMQELATKYVNGRAAEVIIQHCAAPERASQLASAVRSDLPNASVHVVEVGAVISAHVGLGTISLVVCP